MLVSGYEFHKLCKYSFCPRYDIKLFPKDLDENSFVFLNLDQFVEFVKYTTNTDPINKFNLLTHNHDITFTKRHFDIIEKYTNKIYALNCDFIHEKIHKIPIGFVDNKYKPHQSFFDLLQKKFDKDILLYMNFCINTNLCERTKCFNFFTNKQWVTQEQNIQPIEFYTKLAMSKYVLSPAGTGIDCHRIYESIYFGAIPIIKSCTLNDLYEKLPVVIVPEWNEITKEYLELNYDKFKNNLDIWKTQNSTWTDAKFWIIH